MNRCQQKTNIQEILSRRTKEELVDFLCTMAHEYAEIEERIMLDFGNNDDENEVKSCFHLIRTYIDKYSDRDGFINYEHLPKALRGAEMVLEKAHDAYMMNKHIHAVKLSLCVIRELHDMLESYDDYEGDIESLLEDSFFQIDDIIEDEELNSADKEGIFQILYQEAQHHRYNHTNERRLRFLGYCTSLAVKPYMRQMLEDSFTALIAREKGNSCSDYFVEQVQWMRYSLIEGYEGKKKAREFLKQHLHYPSFRKMAIESALKRKDYAEAIKLAEEGEAQDQAWRGRVAQWKEYRYQAYKLTGDIEKQRSIAFDLVMGGNFDYYQQLKEMYDAAEWPSIYSKLLSALENQKGAPPQIYIRILIEEGEKQKLLDYVKRSPWTILELYPHLLPDFKDEVYGLFINLIEEAAARASKRSHYRGVCDHIRTLQKAGGYEEALKIKQRLFNMYSKRPAFKDELSKIRT